MDWGLWRVVGIPSWCGLVMMVMIAWDEGVVQVERAAVGNSSPQVGARLPVVARGWGGGMGVGFGGRVGAL